MRGKNLALLFLLGAGLLYVGLSPGVYRSMGYIQEEVQATRSILAHADLYPRQAEAFAWPRNGLVSILVHFPFVALGHLVFGQDAYFEDWVLSFEPILFTVGTLAILFLWIRRLTGSEGWAFLLSAATAFGTMFWPYAYIGLEVQQGFFLLLSGFIAFEHNRSRTWPRVILFALCCAIAVSAKTAGTVLLPVTALMIWGYFRSDHSRRIARSEYLKLVVTILLIALVYEANSRLQMKFWDQWGGNRAYLLFWMVKDPISYVMNVIAFLGSPNKGLIVFAPLAILSILAIPGAWKERWEVAAFSLFAFLFPLLGFSLLIPWTDENWGPRYLYSSIAPLVLCLALVHGRKPFRARREAPLLAALVFGMFVSFLGAAFSYGALHRVAQQTTQSTLETLQGDPVWNHVKFNARLLQVWVASHWGNSTVWKPYHHWYFSVPDDAPRLKAFDLREVMEPQAVLVRTWPGSADGRPPRMLWIFHLTAFVLGVILLLTGAMRLYRRPSLFEEWSEAAEEPLMAEAPAGPGSAAVLSGEPTGDERS
ncbi:MAG: hypothetical protein ABI718_00250 [Acidobacteriota bacterium]